MFMKGHPAMDKKLKQLPNTEEMCVIVPISKQYLCHYSGIWQALILVNLRTISFFFYVRQYRTNWFMPFYTV